MAGPVMGHVEVNVNHVIHRAGTIEAGDFMDQTIDHGRLERLVELIDRACTEAGFSRQSTELLASMQHRAEKNGHMPELHLVLVQLPDYLSSQLQSVVAQREKGGR
jgi:hypothetical protein